jgi:hypothetical protein
MLADTLTVGSAGTELIFDKLFGDAQAGARYSVTGLALASLPTLAIQHRKDKSQTVRTLIDLSTNVPVAGSTTGAYTTRRLYANVVTPPSGEYQDFEDDCARLATLLTDLDFLGRVFAQQV